MPFVPKSFARDCANILCAALVGAKYGVLATPLLAAVFPVTIITPFYLLSYLESIHELSTLRKWYLF